MSDSVDQKDGAAKKWKFSQLIADPQVNERFQKVRKYFFLRESTYDMTNRCNMRCDGCYYFTGEKQFAKERADPEAWRTHIREEKARGINYIILAGAEPALVPELCQVCYDEIPLGNIVTNGVKRIPESAGYRINISVWGNDETSNKYRKAKNLLSRQIKNYRDDPRAIFLYTFSRLNIAEISEVMKPLVDNGCKVSFSMFSSPVGYKGPLRHDRESLMRTREAMIEQLERYPENVIFSVYNAVAHTHSLALHDLFSCSYPRMNPKARVGLGKSFKRFRTDLTWDSKIEDACCIPDTECADCRHYAPGSAVIPGKLHRHARDPDTFKSWLDYTDTYLAVWVNGYEKGENLCNKVVAPPGHDLF